MHTAALASDTSINVQRYSGSTWLTALQTDSDSSSSGRSDDEADHGSDHSSGNSSKDELGAQFLPVAVVTLNSPEELCLC